MIFVLIAIVGIVLLVIITFAIIIIKQTGIDCSLTKKIRHQW